MHRLNLTAILLTLVLGAAGITSGCGGGDDDKAATDPSNTEAARDAEKQAREQVTKRIRQDTRERKAAARRKRLRARKKPQTAAERAVAVRRRKRQVAAERQREREADEKADREFDKGFQESRFDKLVAKLPIRRPPLYVEQYITSEGSHRVHTAVNRERFLCKMTPAQRLRAVRTFFRAADRTMRAGGVSDFSQVVTLTSDTTQNLQGFAEARRGSVRLTARGRERDPC